MSKSHSWYVPFLFLILGGVALTLGQGHWPNGIALILGLILWIRFFRMVHPAIAIPLAAIANVLVSELAFHGMVPLPTGARIGMFSGISLLFSFLYFADRWVNRRMTSLLATLVLPCGWVAFDLASARFSPGATWASIAYSFTGNDLVIQIASIAGWTGVTFVAVWFASTANWIWDRWQQPAERGKGLILVAAATVAIFAYGVYRLNTAQDGQVTRIGCIVAPDTFNDEYLNDVWAYTRGVETNDESVARARQRIGQSMEEHFALVESAVAQDAEMVLWPEANAIMTLAEEVAWIERAKQISKDNGVYIGMGLIVFRPGTGERTLNKFVLVDDSGNVVMDLLKATRVPGSGNAKGDGILPTVDSKFGKLSAAICFDMDFPHLIAQASQNRIDMFFAPSNDWKEVRDIHAEMARIRSIEQGFSLLRPTKDGTTIMTDCTGRIYSSVIAEDDRTALLVSEMPVRRRATLYSIIGDSFGFACGLMFVVLIGVALTTKRAVNVPEP